MQVGWIGFKSGYLDLLPRIRRGKTKPPLSLVPMAIYELDPVDRIALAAVGEPGQRRFFLQATGSGRTLTLGCEKGQVQALVVRLHQMLEAQQIENPEGAASEEASTGPAPREPEGQTGEMGPGCAAGRSPLRRVPGQASAGAASHAPRAHRP